MTVTITKAYFMVPVDDMDRAMGFYRDVLGLTPQFSSPEWSELAWRDATVALHRGGDRRPESWLGFQVEDLEATLSAMEAAGGRRVRESNEGGMRLVSITDTEGNVLTIGGPPAWS
jgi:predicted enzyme related to lactoylglutathione lyase